MNRFVRAAIGATTLCFAALPAQAQNDCPAPTVSVQSAKKFVDTRGAAANGAQASSKPEDDIVQLGDTIELTVTGLPDLLADIDCRKAKSLPKRTLALFLAAQPIKGLTGYLPGPPSQGKIAST